MQNSIYGADIQPIACQIAKLRFFISLVIEQDSDSSAPNLGIRPLPNLETRFVAADVLLGLERPTQIELGQTEHVARLERELTANRERHFHAGDRSRKLRLRERDSMLRIQLADELQGVGFEPGAARNIAHWDPYDQNAHAGWFDPEYMFGVHEGFDVVIGNPPYIQLQKEGGRARRRYKNAGFETFASTGDIYQLFYERGCRLLRPDTGTLAYITSNSWLKAEYGRRLRKWFADNHMPLNLIEMGKDVFDAIVDTAVLIVRNGKGQPVTCSAVDVEQAADDRFPPPKRDWGTLQLRGDRPWMALSQVERTVMDKMDAVGTPLRDWDISIYRGILTGYNTAFIVNRETRDALVAADARSVEILKPILRGRDIARYRANWAGLWLIDTHNGYAGVPPIDVNEHPAIKAHLDKSISYLKRRQDKGITPYNLRNCAYHADFAKDKVVWIELADKGRFAFDETGMFVEATTFMLTGVQARPLCALLNSTLAHWYIRKTAPTSGMGTSRWKKVYVESIPLVTANEDLTTLSELVDEARNCIEVNSLSRIEEQVDSLVFQAYGISKMEADVIKSTTQS